MKNEIERKFFVKNMPDLSGIIPISYERYFLKRESGEEIRISKIGESYVYEEKSEVSSLERTREKREISKEEFEELKKNSSEAIIREKYVISSDPNIAIQIYHGKFEGLIRAEVEFDSEEEAKMFSSLPWMGEEMTGLPIARDAKLLDLTDLEFKKYLS
jgi:adenylate cyclase